MSDRPTIDRRAAALLATLALALAARALELPDGRWHDVQRQPDGSCRLSLAAGAPADWRPGPLVFDTPRTGLALRRSDGRPAASGAVELAREGGRRRVALRLDRGDLAAGLTVSETGAFLDADRPLSDVAPPDPWADRLFLRLEVDREGLVRVTQEWLDERVPGPWPDPRRWTLVHEGRAEPMRVQGAEDGSFDPGDRFEFYSEPTVPDVDELGPDTRIDPWSRTEVWFLALDDGPGPRLGQESGEIVETDPSVYASPLTFPESIHVEETEHFSRLTYVLDEALPDHSFWTTGIYAGQLRQVAFQAPGLDRYSLLPPKLTVCLRGLTAPAEPGDADVFQRMRLFVNSQGGSALEVGAGGDWKNQDLRIVEFGSEAFPDHSSFLDGANALFLSGVDEPPAGEFSAAMLDWIDLDYRRVFRAEGDRLLFRADDALDGRLVDFNLEGFGGGDVEVWKLGQSWLRNVIVRRGSESWRLRFQDRYVRGARYLALRENAKIEPVLAEATTPRRLADPGRAGACLVIAADSLLRGGGAAVLAPLLEAAAAEHGSAELVSDRWIYDEFSAGKVRPHAIRDFVARARASWADPPRFVLLLGDGVQVQRNLLSTVEPVLPLLYRQVGGWGAASDDDWYVQTRDGQWTDALLARWPVSSPSELENLVDKALGYAAAPGGEWRNRLLLVAGAHPRDEGVFLEQMEQLVRFRLPDRAFVRRIEAGADGERYVGGLPELRAFLEQGVSLVNYSGHGGGAVWEDNDLFSSGDVAGLDNGARLPFVTNATCFIASLEFEGALGRALLNAGPQGAIGVLGSTGLGYRDAGAELVGDFWELVLANPDLSVARALRVAEERMRVNHVIGREGTVEARNARAVIAMNTILGLPWQTLRLPVEGTAPGVDPPAVAAGGAMVLAGRAAAAGLAGSVELYSANSHPQQDGADFVDEVSRWPFTAGADGDWSVEVPLPATLYRGGDFGSLRVWTADADGDGASAASWFYLADSLDRAFLWRAGFDPDPVRPGQAARVGLLAAAPEPIDSLWITMDSWSLAGGDTLRLSQRLQAADGDPQRFASPDPLGPWSEGDRLRVRFHTAWGGRVETSTNLYHDIVSAAPALEWSWLGHGREFDGLALVRLDNGGDGAIAEGAWSAVLEDASGAALQEFAGPALAAGGSLEWRLALEAGAIGDSLDLRATADPAPAPLAFVLDEVVIHGAPDAGDPRPVDAGLELGAPAAPGRRVAVRRIAASERADQPGLELALPGWETVWLDGEPPATLPLRLRAALDSAAFAALRPLAWLSEAGRFAVAPAGAFSPLDTAALSSVDWTGQGISLGRFLDSTPPDLVFEVEGQVFSDGGFVAPRAAIDVVGGDADGLDPRLEAILVELDGAALEEGDWSSHYDAGTGRLSVRVVPDADENHQHVLAVELRDCAGNAARVERAFVVSAGFALEYIGNYPNPFRQDTRFVFSLTGVADEAAIDIYTVAGRRIRTLRLGGPLINYVELPWDGRDRSGEKVANGVYFYRFTAKGPRGSIERTGKLARLK